MAEETPGMIQVPLVWVGEEDVPIHLANKFIVVFSEDGEFILSVGQMAPPAFIGTPEEVTEQAKRVTYLPVKPLARLAMTEHTVRQLAGVLEEILSKYDSSKREGETR